MNLSIHANTRDGLAVYNLQRRSKDEFDVQVDWDKSQVRSGGFGLSFNPQDELEVRGPSDQFEWNILVAPEGHENSVFVVHPPNGMRHSGEPPTFDQIDFDSPITKEQSRQVALQVASSLIQVPFLERMLNQPVPGEATPSQPQGEPLLPQQDLTGAELSVEQKAKATAVASQLASMLEVPASEINVTSFAQKGLNPGHWGFPVEGQPQLAAFTQGVEMQITAGEQKFVFRGEGPQYGAFGEDSKHEGYWKADDKGIYRPGAPFPSFENDW